MNSSKCLKGLILKNLRLWQRSFSIILCENFSPVSLHRPHRRFHNYFTIFTTMKLPISQQVSSKDCKTWMIIVCIIQIECLRLSGHCSGRVWRLNNSNKFIELSLRRSFRSKKLWQGCQQREADYSISFSISLISCAQLVDYSNNV